MMHDFHDFSLCHHVQTGRGAYHVSSFFTIKGSFSGGTQLVHQAHPFLQSAKVIFKTQWLLYVPPALLEIT
jgi:hypothetical protein